MTADLLSIGQVADATGLAVSAVRYYDEIGIIESATRIGGKRRFEPATVSRVRFIQRSRDVGFSLEQIGLILDDEVGDWHELVDEKLIELAEKRDRLDEMIEVLTEVRSCGCEVVATCSFRTPCC